MLPGCLARSPNRLLLATTHRSHRPLSSRWRGTGRTSRCHWVYCPSLPECRRMRAVKPPPVTFVPLGQNTLPDRFPTKPESGKVCDTSWVVRAGAVPAGPVAPVAPVDPVAPVVPVAPVAPVAPVPSLRSARFPRWPGRPGRPDRACRAGLAPVQRLLTCRTALPAAPANTRRLP